MINESAINKLQDFGYSVSYRSGTTGNRRTAHALPPKQTAQFFRLALMAGQAGLEDAVDLVKY